jgi:hypothetical protein
MEVSGYKLVRLDIFIFSKGWSKAYRRQDFGSIGDRQQLDSK